ncbi:MAG: RNA methyltransferase [bacterium]|nr:RNA methyltransferase [bacterium]
MIITSLENDKIKNYIKLKEKKYRDFNHQFLIEGLHLIEEAQKENLVDELIVEIGCDIGWNLPTIQVTREIIKKLSSLDNPPSPTILAICHKKVEDLDFKNKILLLDNIQDPGNLGTIIRSSKAFNVDTIILSEDTVDLYNPKVIRSTQGIMFHINIVRKDLKEVISFLKKEKVPIYGTNVETGIDIQTLSSNDTEKYALIMGNEGQGVKKEILDLCDQYIYISMNEEVESLNVGVATSILLYELNRRNTC